MTLSASTAAGIDAHLIDGTYEMFRHHYGQPEEARSKPGTRGATRGVLSTVYYLLEEGATHVGVATDQVIESFRNRMWPGYKTSAGMDPLLLAQFPIIEEGLTAMGVYLWPMVELEADDALASAAAVLADDPGVAHVVIHTPDKDLAQCVRDSRVVQFERRNKRLVHEDLVIEKFGVPPSSIPDYLALVGDSADGFPGLAGWGAKSTAAVLRKYPHLEDIPVNHADWKVNVRGSVALASVLESHRDDAFLFRDLATLRIDRSLLAATDDLRWRGPTESFRTFCTTIDADQLAERTDALSLTRS